MHNKIKVKTVGTVNKKSTCIQCDCKIITAKYRKKIWNDEMVLYEPCVPVIERICTFCKYIWYEKPLTEEKNERF
jgi:hypothetical protein